ncbi:(4Fe-4S)-binding protein [Streptomyces sp. JUS-F4]|nr:(4Fe-4S)-binding protein [Streptomyces sp. JUS-F4]MCL6288191.1 (4Fe-4S)-binding protein [Streptomyces sp. 43Y-GA-1]MCX4712279.1 (4Fe-4S)-binding protein [Streptomyces griseus]MDX3341378.1 (4Fe-4S)-binding protein [Streptomyces sp. ME02-6979.5a]WKN17923.1 (4Fe-4S)-binding protein [Streptomyces sp. JUS-F4]WTC86499.1 (4Fe-4S)-binding protein [Streptomyces griseus]
MPSQPPPRPAAKSYDGEGIVVGFDPHRCLHAAECVRGLPTVFDVGRRPQGLSSNCRLPGDAWHARSLRCRNALVAPLRDHSGALRSHAPCAARPPFGRRRQFDDRPWVQPGNAPADEVADVVHRCPSGALQYHRTDGMPDEVPDVPTHVSLHADGVLHLRGDLEVATPYGPRHETRVMLCGCGATGNTPYCDHSGHCAEHG